MAGLGLDREEARSWSKERIRAEIDLRRDELRDSEDWVTSTDQEHSREQYRNAEPGWSRGAEAFQMDLRDEIGFLTSLL